jgi:hypothetical protein
MSTAKAQKILLERLASGAVALLSLHLALPTVPAWADGQDAVGRAVVLVGAHALRALPDGEAAVAAVLGAVREGYVPDGVHAVDYRPKASGAWAAIVEGPAEQVLVDGPRGSGKTQMIPGALAGLAERHARAGYPLPLRVLWLHDSMVNASVKTGRSAEEPLWGGLLALRDDRRVVALTIGGVEMVLADFVGVQDATSGDRARAAAHVLVAEEVVPSLTESGGVEERIFDLARSSIESRLPTRRTVAVAVTNPGSPETWPFKRFIQGGGQPGCVRCPVPASDRLSPAQEAALIATFRDAPDLQQRLGRGEWAELVEGAAVTPGFTDAHAAPERLRPVADVPLWLGHDGGHTPVTIVGAHYQGSVLIYAALASVQAGTRQHVEQLVKPWLSAQAPWALRHASTLLQHRYDPSMETGENADIDQDPVRVLRELLGGFLRPGAVSWPGRLEPITALLGRFNTFTGRPTLQIDAVDAALLIRALRGRWCFPVVNGVVSRDLPIKNHPWSDLGDGFAYLVGGIAPSRDWDAVRAKYAKQRYATGTLSWLTAERESRRAASSTWSEDR